MSTEIEAVYRNGVLELKTGLPLKDGQTVRVVVLADGETIIKERLAAMHTAADDWLAEQTRATLPAEPDYPPEEWTRLDTELNEILADIRQQTDQHPEDEIVADVEAAVDAVRRQRHHQPK